ncbi:nicotinate-nucleotide--dimethylbenzimidazole phosphoribosyltransferase [Butyrivibrio sp. DSM 10294]|uniref:nicotinate-nucleotide--dimethylbenzimidazole phosphoribosyltransferase n=1 Tax=Butyrivibrio sp. DSM 10294 TaxID=2972457 RepID=UPI00234F33AE|nr:nicotinate-nucleotide--dimethylbenzimidazole phosphoribosyltransferase [Butyrivibrio sp. DSM 10294]MDC7294522.1 nicotinate-nucleotide--dimethylbenzimidazole phosphoribosyltransferase [Butyrivibrio sp. DSM 10294]
MLDHTILKELNEIKIDKPDSAIYSHIKSCWDGISKPIDGLGDFEELICRIGAIQRNKDPQTSKRAAIIFCADNGIVEEGVSQSGKDITLSVAKALGSGISSACSLGRYAKTDIVPVDIGIDSDEEIPGVRDMKVSRGTCNFTKEPAMTYEQTLNAIEKGRNLVKELSDSGYGIIATGEMGIGNTTTSAAVLTALLGFTGGNLAGRGAGLSDSGLDRKRQVIGQAIVRYSFDRITDERVRAFEILSTLGGLDIAGLTGAFIGGAQCHIPMVTDGVISNTAALVADILVPGIRDYLIPSHRGREAGNSLALEKLGLTPYINGNMALGEGTGALMLFPLLDMVMDYYLNGAKFADYSIDEYKRFDT